MDKSISKRIRWAEHTVSLGFYLYAFGLAPSLARALRDGMQQKEAMWLPGLVLLLGLCAEPVGLRWKMQFLRRRNHDSGFVPEGPMLGFFSTVGISHVIVTVLGGMVALDAWGLLGDGSEELSGWCGAALIALVFKEIAGLFAAGGTRLSPEPPGHVKEIAANLILLLYGLVAYTAWWSALVDVEAFRDASAAVRWGFLPVLAVLFLFFYLPMRMPFWLDEFLLSPRRGRKLRIGAELAVGTLLGLYPALF